jgi:hypothetical protein
VHYLDPIFVLEERRTPISAAHDSAIQFNSDSRGRQLELCDEFG